MIASGRHSKASRSSPVFLSSLMIDSVQPVTLESNSWAVQKLRRSTSKTHWDVTSFKAVFLSRQKDCFEARYIPVRLTCGAPKLLHRPRITFKGHGLHRIDH